LNDTPIHPNDLSIDNGVFLVKLARKAVELKLKENKEIKPLEDTPRHLLRPGMCFTTIEAYYGEERRELRGCIGFLTPVYPLAEAVIRSALEAAFGDPRFPPLQLSEISNVTFEVAVLSVPTKYNVDNRWELPSKIVIGKHGLVAKKGFFQGTLLPQVPVEYCWDEETFLAETCIKAGLEPSCWLDEATEITYYEGKVFREVKPYGEIEERDLHAEYIKKCR